MFEKYLSEIDTIIEEIYSFSNRGIFYLKNEDYSNLNKILNIREKKIQSLNSLRTRINELTKENLTKEEINQLNRKIGSKIENVSKVDKKLFDIITWRQKNIGDKIQQATQGLSFLRNHKNQLNSKRTILKTF